MSAPDENGWMPIDSAPKDDTLFLACCPPDEQFPKGRIMIWRGSILAFQDDRTPNHLRFPATHWQPLPKPPVAPYLARNTGSARSNDDA